ncbi:MAG TPA: GNAT family N-acetyltransferase [Roseiflexaceae bacterium]|nr:GNAT family N-acetyltransferase [Roseiflexaceae bacterium]
MHITTLTPDDTAAIDQAAALLTAGFSENWPDSWADQESALEEVHEMLDPERICRVARADDGRVLGWIGGVPEYDGRVWELHPLVVDPQLQGRGVGRALVADLEEQVRGRGGLTVSLGTDDVSGMTSLAGVDLYPNVWEHIAAIRNLRRHPYEFYQKCGFVIVGVVPDANGPGKPDIMMAKRVRLP